MSTQAYTKAMSTVHTVLACSNIASVNFRIILAYVT